MLGDYPTDNDPPEEAPPEPITPFALMIKLSAMLKPTNLTLNHNTLRRRGKQLLHLKK